MNEIYEDQDMTTDEWERYGANFEARYQEHLRSLNTNVQGGRPQRRVEIVLPSFLHEDSMASFFLASQDYEI